MLNRRDQARAFSIPLALVNWSLAEEHDRSYYAGRNLLLAWSMIGLPFPIVVLLILSTWRLSKRNR